MRVTRPTRALAGPLAAVVLGAGLLSGCSVGEDVVRPSDAAVVGEETISVSQVDDVAEATCGLLREFPELIGPGQDGASLRSQVLTQLVLGSMAEQIADEEGLDAEELRREAEETVRQQLGGNLERETVDPALPYFASQDFLSRVFQEVVGEVEEGEDVNALFTAYLADWQETNGYEVNPRYEAVDFRSEDFRSGRRSLSVPVSDEAMRATRLEVAQEGLGVNPDAETELQQELEALPESQRCSP